MIGVPDERTGEAVVAYVVPHRWAQTDASDLAERVRSHCETRLARFKVPSRMQVVGELPHSATGKVAKGRLRASEARGRWVCVRPARHRVRLLSKPGCHLCDDARIVIEAVCADLGEAYDEVDITTDPELMQQYGEQIPVTFVDGKQHDYWRVDPERLRDGLS